MEPLYTRYIQETFGPDGQVTDWHYQYEDNFNYAYDILDTMAAAEPWRMAMLWRRKLNWSVSPFLYANTLLSSLGIGLPFRRTTFNAGTQMSDVSPW